MIVLGLDTASKSASVAVTEDGVLRGEATVCHALTHSQTLMPMLSDMLCRCGMQIEQVELIGVSAGPGSFTGLRIGVATAKALAHALGRPVVGVSTLKSIAYNLPFCAYPIAALLDARRNQAYAGVYRHRGGVCETVMADAALPIAALLDTLDALDTPVVFAGDGTATFADAARSRLGERALFAPAGSNLVLASSVCALATDEAQAGHSVRYDRLVPAYFRKSQAEREYEARNKLKGAEQ